MSASLIVERLRERRAGIDRPDVLPETTTYLAPTAPGPGRRTEDGLWVPPGASIASRMPPARSRGSCRGSIVDPAANRVIVYESALERDFAYMLMADRRVAHIHDQPPAVTYKTPDGRTCRHTFDFLVLMTSGDRVAFAVKPKAKVKQDGGIREVLALVSKQAPRGFADRFLLRTEEHITKDRAFNARWVLRARRGRNDDDVAVLRDVVDGMLNGSVRMTDLVALSKLGARGWNAAVCLIDDGVLELLTPGRIGDLALVRRRQVMVR
jgi:hypothetical protein